MNFAVFDSLRETFFHNVIYFGVAFVLLLVATLVVMGAVQRVSGRILRARSLALSTEIQESWRRKLRRATVLSIVLTTLFLLAATLVLTWQKVRIGDFLRGGLERMQGRDWLTLGLAVLQTFGIILAAFIVARFLVAALHYLRERLQHAESLSGHRERLAELLVRLRLALTSTVLFSTVLLCARLLGLPDGVRRVLWSLACIGIGVYLGRFAVGAAHLLVDVLFDLSDVFSRFESPLRYLGRFRHLSSLTKRTVDYFIYVGIATWIIEQVTPGAGATQLGRSAIRIIAIFYISRVLVEVCVLLMNEFFLVRGKQTDVEFQQRQTLVPVAAGLLRYGIYFAAFAMMLREAGIDPTPLLAGAGVVGVAIGLGAQAFVGDIVAGFFILFENLILVGDFVEIGSTKGRIEEIGVRVTRLRDESGVLHAIPNGEVRRVANHSRGYVNVVIDIPVPYEEDLHKVFAALTEKTAAVRAKQAAIIGVTEFALEDLREGAVLLRSTTMVKPGTSPEMSAVLRLAFWEALNQAGIAAPYARRMLLSSAPDSNKSAQPASRSISNEQSDIQKLKAHNLYLAFDVDTDGYVDRDDVEALVRRVIDNQRRAPGSVLHAELQRAFYSYWGELLGFTDKDKDARISREEFLQFCLNLGDTPSVSAAASIQALAEALFTVADHDGRGTISLSEFIQWGRAYGITDTALSAAFELLDNDHDDRVDRDEWTLFLRAVFTSRELNDAAALVFGPGCRAT